MSTYCGSDLIAHTPVLYEPPTIDFGLHMLAFTCLTGALEDACGRGSNNNSDATDRRMRSCAAIKWLRDWRHPSPPTPFTIHWCSLILGVDAHTLALEGVHRIPFSGLLHWRRWRKDRDCNRIKRLPLLTRRCPQCHQRFRTKNKRKIHCSQSCFARHQAQQPRARAITYERICEHCHRTYETRDVVRTYCSVACRSAGQRADRYDRYGKHRERTQEQAVCV